jgi:hypothetical protein
MCQTPVLSAALEEFRFSNPEAIQARLFFGTTTVQLSERENARTEKPLDFSGCDSRPDRVKLPSDASIGRRMAGVLKNVQF